MQKYRARAIFNGIIDFDVDAENEDLAYRKATEKAFGLNLNQVGKKVWDIYLTVQDQGNEIRTKCPVEYTD